MRYFTIEQRETLRDALTHRASLLRSQRPHSGHHGKRLNAADGRIDFERRDDSAAAEAVAEATDQQTSQLRKIEETLARLRSPEFGICEDCQGGIAYVLLSDNPFTTLCRQCQQRRDLAAFVPHEI